MKKNEKNSANLDYFEQKLFNTDNLYGALKQRKELLVSILAEKKNALNNSTSGYIRINVKKKGAVKPQYYLRETSSQKSGKYLRKGNEQLISTLIQKDYDEKILNRAEEELKYITKLLNHLAPNNLSRIYDSMIPERQQWIIPVMLSDAEYINRWMNRTYESMGFDVQNAVYETRSGLRVRSKSEMLIANLLDEYQVPYLYECPLMDKNGIWACPDFTVLNVKNRKEFYWEHLGMLDDSVYLQKNLAKIAKYESHGIIQGKNLLLSYESSVSPINMKEIELLIQNYLI